MKKLLIIILAMALFAPVSFAGKHHSVSHTYSHAIIDHDDERHTELDVAEGSVFVTGRDEYDDVYGEMEITEDFELYVDGKLIETTPKQQKLLKEYHTLIFGIRERAKEIGWEGAKIGLAGAKLGLSAVGRVLKMLVTDYDSDDLEREMERDAARIEARAEELEDAAEEIERWVEDIEDIHWELEDEIEEVRKLRLF